VVRLCARRREAHWCGGHARRIAEFERELIRERTSEGRRAQANGVRFGRKPKLTAHQRAEPLQRRSTGEALATIARTCNVNRNDSIA